MTLFRRGQQPDVSESGPERRLRFLLRKAPAPLMRSVMAVAVEHVSSHDRDVLLEVIREQLMAGHRTANDAYDDLGRLVVLGEHRTPGAILRHLPEDMRERLADAVLQVSTVENMMTGYDRWDGADPVPVVQTYDKTTGERSGHGESHYDVVKGRAEGGFST